MSRKAVFNCDTCTYEETYEFFTEETFRDSELTLELSHRTDIGFKLERPSRQLCPECQQKAAEELKEFLRASNYFY